ncbi:hypothetical protein A3D05_02575 [Candidatus Gottesmanbacteria bacterium RIFCSPHIGHO2_02_FULL_40_24]|uniref:Uncharacterized protein n=1 Tax=Candidatus Gottesmanbacteria bacterium RIFCSPHIGHO2_01_FULL_40_15 TaxID=1798376 RepID=A0A1F5Z631_9BACT|nr:MAG: hypothetical protein A2777_00580 [Candidatus Gottesmanbacteria bacterium RIFCSPHIGHO2_01_FULL_40_15]OGG18735.1 MAG: hypothetical protein A3D05_02575 [Candidatus Gottesmanbacteria bacterium RIFCSPHIGHO2_02_FULL_40_24]OGG20912.1 MAG: hypothetical protein A3B48_05930 [Candidatus Gottesmanbacteria bacterium RIFCSPLOWO2_01_FULL_40_10]OGG23026.1 MAG: hypothetical protein A3E42_06785 [Candidatus Gottesmanbacteria bacterium RIFCSPHIGHO2_12_FULL_40_13]
MPADSDSSQMKPVSPSPVTPVSAVTGPGKESESVTVKKDGILEAVGSDIEIEKEVENAGVEKLSGSYELPPDVKKLGVSVSNAQSPVFTAAQVSLPITDDKILEGLKAPLSSAFKWLAVWCIKKLQKAHLVLKSIHGKIIRVKVRD